jgi:hypothetical protein
LGEVEKVAYFSPYFTTSVTTYFTTATYFTSFLKVTVFDRNPEGVVAVKFKQSAAAEDCIRVMNNRFFGGTHTRARTHKHIFNDNLLCFLLYFTGRQIECDFWDNKMNYIVVVVVCVYTYIRRHICKHVCVCVCIIYFTTQGER